MDIPNKTKTKKIDKRHHFSAIKSLPEDLVVELLARVASSSFTDLHNAKLSCRVFLNASKDEYIFQRVCIDKFRRVPWKLSTEAFLFLKRCKDSENPEVLYREGMVEFFSLMRTESGLRNLKKASRQGHVEASYVYGMILLCSRNGFDGSKQEGVRVLSSVKGLRECRRRIKDFVWNMWINNPLIYEERILGCRTSRCDGYDGVRSHTTAGKRGWDWTDDDDDNDGVRFCDSCKWDREVRRFCNLLRNGSFWVL